MNTIGPEVGLDSYHLILAFCATAALLTITPGADTALVLRIAVREGGRAAFATGVGVVGGVLVWGLLAGAGLGALIGLSEIGYRILQIAGAIYLLWLAFHMFRSAVREEPIAAVETGAHRTGGWFFRGLMTNLLNPKVGLFYVSLLPQFIPSGSSVFRYSVLYSGIHAVLGIAFFAVLVRATDRIGRWLRHPVVARTIDGVIGTVLVLFAARLLVSGPRQ